MTDNKEFEFLHVAKWADGSEITLRLTLAGFKKYIAYLKTSEEKSNAFFDMLETLVELEEREKEKQKQYGVVKNDE